jgi:ribosome biogenesis protein ENP2
MFFPELNKFDPRARPGQTNQRAQIAYSRNRERNRLANVNLVPMRPQTESNGAGRMLDKSTSFGQRRTLIGNSNNTKSAVAHRSADQGLEMSWVPNSLKQTDEDMLIPGNIRTTKSRRKGVVEFGAGMEKGGEEEADDVTESERKGRTQRRKGVRSGSKNTFRRLEG